MFHFFPLESRSSELDGETEPSHPEGRKLTYERDFLLQLQTHPLSQIKPEGLPDLEVVLGQARTLSKSCFSQNRMQKSDGNENMFLPSFMRQQSRVSCSNY
ncbi:unnamed protein product [Porites evermanni]|uniref:Uncharacterized protein n=1 Tax=Porites evermanni TaxID=104178 RepID=A0ABN8MVQ6_9CNID|nr:unnamed protein product [Porites evermanni]